MLVGGVIKDAKERKHFKTCGYVEKMHRAYKALSCCCSDVDVRAAVELTHVLGRCFFVHRNQIFDHRHGSL